MRKSFMTAVAAMAVALGSSPAGAEAVFRFSQQGADVVMTSSGFIDVTKLIPKSVGLANGYFIETGLLGYDTMGGVDAIELTVGFGFSQGTDYSAWADASGPFTLDQVSTLTSGGRAFSTHVLENNAVLPGLSVIAADIVGDIWTPDQTWTWANKTLADLGLVAGIYTVRDAATSESLTYQVDGAEAVPEPASMALLGGAILGLGLMRRAKARAAGGRS